MEPVSATTKLNNLTRQQSEGCTKMNAMQPLDVIGNATNEESFEEVLKTEKEKLQTVENKYSSIVETLRQHPLAKLAGLLTSDESDDEEEYQEGYGKICEYCQIPKIAGDCKKCGLYQYGDNYEFLLRRRQ